MDRADRTGLAVAVVGHALLFAVLSLHIARRAPPPRVEAAPLDVQLVDETGARSAAPEPATEAPRQQRAVEEGPADEAAPPPAPTPSPKPTPPAARPTPPEPKPAPPEPKPAPPPPTPAKPKPTPPKPAPAKPAPAPSPKPKPKPAAKAPEPAAPAKPAKPVAERPATHADAKPTQTAGKAAAKPAKPVERTPLGADLLGDLRATARAEGRATAKGAGEGKGQRSAGRLGPDFLKGVVNPSAGKGATARAALTGPQMNGLAAAIRRQVQPCYDLGSLGGTPAMGIVTVLQLRFGRDGAVQGVPRLVEQQGVTAANRAYARQMEEVSRRAVLRCAPLKLPAELYAGGWENLVMGFIPGQMQ